MGRKRLTRPDHMRYKGLNLNLLFALHALLIDRNVSTAAKRVFLSQSAMSAALAQLRLHFKDELFVQVGRAMVPTAFCESLSEPIETLMLQVESIVGLESHFNPATSKRRFRIWSADFVQEVIFSKVIERLSREAPGVLLEFISSRDSESGDIESGAVDLMVMTSAYLSRLFPAELLYEEDHVVVGWVGNPHLQEPLTLEKFFDLGHVVVRIGRNRNLTYHETEANKVGLPRKIELIAPTFSAIPKFIVGTNRIAIMHRRLAEVSARVFPIALSPLPFEMPPLRVMMQHHSARDGDGGMQWLKTVIRECTT